MEEMRIVASRGEGELTFDSYDAGQLFEEGTRALNAGRCQEAVERYYERLAREFPSSRFVAPALYNAGLCSQEAGQLETAAAFYRRVLERAPASRDGRHAGFQLVQVLLRLELSAEALELTDRLLLREDLAAPERLEGLSRRAQALLGLERIDDAERQARDALSYYRTRQGEERIDEPQFAAAANFVLAETLRRRSERIEVPPAEVRIQREVLDARARLMLDAQREYFSTIRLTDPHWAAASGYQIGAMYEGLWQAMMQAPIPPPAVAMNPATQALYERDYRAELARHIRPLMRHAIRYWEMTLLMVERTGVRTEWAERTRADLERMRGLLLDQREPAGDGEGASSMAPRIPEALRLGALEHAGEAISVVERAASPGRGTRIAANSSGGARPPRLALRARTPPGFWGALARAPIPAGSEAGTDLP